MITVRFLHRDEWEARLRAYSCEPLEGKGPLNTIEWWRTSWNYPFTVPIESDGRCDEWAIHRLILDIVRTAPPDWKFPN
jgi:hypothetical protein